MIWAIIIAVFFSGYGIYKWITTEKETIVVNCDFTQLPEMAKIENIKISKSKVAINKENPAVIIDLPNLKKTGYTETVKLASPIIMFAKADILNYDSGFSVSNGGYTGSSERELEYRTASKNFETILLAFEQDKTWKDIGIQTVGFGGKINISVPDKYSKYRNIIRDFFLLTLKDDEITPELEERVDKLLNKCYQIENIEGEMIKSIESDVGSIIIFPEFILNEYSSGIASSYNTTNNKYIVPIYPTYTNAIWYSVYVKDDITKEQKERILKQYNGKTICSKTGFRSSYNNFADDNLIYRRTIDNVNIIKE